MVAEAQTRDGYDWHAYLEPKFIARAIMAERAEAADRAVVAMARMQLSHAQALEVAAAIRGDGQ